jgi:hypothetical protein
VVMVLLLNWIKLSIVKLWWRLGRRRIQIVWGTTIILICIVIMESILIAV